MTTAAPTPRSGRPSRYGVVSAAGLVLAVAAEACSVGLLGLSGWFIASSAVAGATVYSMFSYLDPSSGVRAFALGRIITTYASRVVLHSAALHRVSAARLAFYDQAAAGPAARRTWSGQSLDRVMADADTVGMALIQATAPVTSTVAMAAGGCAVIAIAGYPLPAVLVALAAVACAALAATSARHAGDVSRARAVVRTELVTAVHAWPEMASLGAAGQLAGRTQRHLAAFSNQLTRRAATQARTAGAARAVTAVAVLLTVLSAAGRGAAVTALVFLALLAAGVMANAERLIPAAEGRALARQARDRLLRGDDGQPLPPSPGTGFRAVFDGHALVASGYRLPRTAPDPGRGTAFTCAAGQTLVVTGASGSGKTTLLNAIAAALSQPGTHPGTVTSVLADDYLFTGTVASNIRLADPAATDRDINGLLTDMLLDRSGLGPATRTGTGGRELSGGEQRRLHIARALATRPDLLLIDEPAAGLDARTATAVLTAIRRRLPHAAIVLAMHEPPTSPAAVGPGGTAVSLDGNHFADPHSSFRQR